MPQVSSFVLPGLFAWFWSNDHNPPHFHLKRSGEWELKVHFLEGRSAMFEPVWGKPPKAKVLKAIAEAVERHRLALLRQWEEDVNV